MIQVVCVVSKGRAARGKVFRMRALIVEEELRGQGLAAEVLAIGKLQGELTDCGGWNEVQAGG